MTSASILTCGVRRNVRTLRPKRARGSEGTLSTIPLRYAKRDTSRNSIKSQREKRARSCERAAVYSDAAAIRAVGEICLRRCPVGSVRVVSFLSSSLSLSHSTRSPMKFNNGACTTRAPFIRKLVFHSS